MSISGNCDAFVTNPNTISAFTKAVHSLCGANSGVSETDIAITLSHTCSSRRRLENGRVARRLSSGTVTATYVITLPQGVSAASVKAVLPSGGSAVSSWQAAVNQGLSAVGLSTFTVTVTSVVDPTVVNLDTTVTITSTSTSTLEAGVDSSAFLQKAFSSAHLWGLIVLFGANHVFA